MTLEEALTGLIDSLTAQGVSPPGHAIWGRTTIDGDTQTDVIMLAKRPEADFAGYGAKFAYQAFDAPEEFGGYPVVEVSWEAAARGDV